MVGEGLIFSFRCDKPNSHGYDLDDDIEFKIQNSVFKINTYPVKFKIQTFFITFNGKLTQTDLFLQKSNQTNGKIRLLRRTSLER